MKLNKIDRINHNLKFRILYSIDLAVHKKNDDTNGNKDGVGMYFVALSLGLTEEGEGGGAAEAHNG